MARGDPTYWRVSPKFWRHASEHGWNDDVIKLALYLLTSEHRTTEGIYRLPLGYMATDLAWLPERLTASLATLTDQDFVRYDEKASIVFIVKAMLYQRPDNPNQISPAVKRVVALPETPLLAGFLQAAQAYAQAFAQALAKALPQGYTDPNSYQLEAIKNPSSTTSTFVGLNGDDAAPVDNVAAATGPEERDCSIEHQEQEHTLQSYAASASPCGRRCQVRHLETLELPAQWLDDESIEAFQGMAGYICQRCHDASAGPGVTMADRQPICAEALAEYVERLKAFDATKHIHNLPAYLRTRLKRMTEAPVPDELLVKLRQLEHRKRGPEKCEREPRRIGDVLPDIPMKAGVR